MWRNAAFLIYKLECCTKFLLCNQHVFAWVSWTQIVCWHPEAQREEVEGADHPRWQWGGAAKWGNKASSTLVTIIAENGDYIRQNRRVATFDDYSHFWQFLSDRLVICPLFDQIPSKNCEFRFSVRNAKFCDFVRFPSKTILFSSWWFVAMLTLVSQWPLQVLGYFSLICQIHAWITLQPCI